MNLKEIVLEVIYMELVRQNSLPGKFQPAFLEKVIRLMGFGGFPSSKTLSEFHFFRDCIFVSRSCNRDEPDEPISPQENIIRDINCKTIRSEGHFE